MVENIKELQIKCHILHYVPSKLQPIPRDMWITTQFIDNGNLKYVYVYINTTTK